MGKRILWSSLAALAIVIVIAMIVGNLWMGRYLRSEPFRQLVSAKAGAALKVDGQFQPLSWTGGSVYSDRFNGSPTPNGYFETLQADRIRVEVNFRKILSGAWRVDEINIGNLAATFGTAQTLKPDSSAPSEPAASSLPTWLPRRFELGTINIDNANLKAKDLALDGAKLTIRPDGQAWIIEGSGGKFLAKNFSELKLTALNARVTADQLFLTNAKGQPASGGNLSATGEMTFGNGESHFQIDFTGIQAKEVFPKEVTHYLSGILSGTTLLKASPGMISNSGNFVLTEGLVKDLPVLQQLAKFTQSPQFERLPLQLMSGDYVQGAKGLHVENFVAESKNLLRIEGRFSIGKNGELDGDFEVGLTPQTLQWLPGSQERVFTQSHGGYLWTKIHLGGTTDSPSEDLSNRLALAMGQQAIKQGANLIKGTPNKALDAVRDAVNILSPLIP